MAVATSSRRGRPARISRDAVVAAAAEIGAADLSMAAIADRLGVTTPALYGHVEGLDEVVSLLARHLLTELDDAGGEATEWRTWLEEFARGVRRVLGGHNASLLIDLNGPLDVDELRAGERGLNLLVDAGFSPADAGRALWLVFRLAVTSGAIDDASVAGAMSAARGALDDESFPTTAEGIRDLADEADLDTFAFDLDCVLAGLEARRSR